MQDADGSWPWRLDIEIGVLKRNIEIGPKIKRKIIFFWEKGK